jgi:hypothetical protein
MAHKSFSYKGFDIYLAALQPSKLRRGGRQRSLQVQRDSRIRKNIRFDLSDPYGYSKASKKACDWIDKNSESAT